MNEEGHHTAPVSPVEQRVAALEALLTERGLVPEGFLSRRLPAATSQRSAR